MIRRPLYTWLAFSVCLAVVLAAMGWASLTVLRLDRAEARAKREAAFEETVRLALWRMDAALAPVVAAESARPYFEYGAFHPAERAYTRMFAPLRHGEVLVPSPLLVRTPPGVTLHFQFAPDGELTSPQAPTGNMRDLAESAYTSHEEVERATRRLRELGVVIARDDLLAGLPRAATSDGEAPPPPRGQGAQAGSSRQALLNTQEWSARQRWNWDAQRTLSPNARPGPSGMSEGVMVPLWVGPGEPREALVLARRIEIDGETYVQGAWLDWPGLKARLLKEVRDLLPAAEVEPVRAAAPDSGVSSSPGGGAPASPSAADDHRRRLASLPARLVPGDAPADGARATSPVRVSLLIAWVCVVLGAGAVAALLSGALALSERRGAFVSAVTHELRTPLTTFRMYAEMLAEGMVPDGEKRREYLRTLCTEADRLGHLVENVLAYARLEGTSARSRLEVVTVGGLLERTKARLEARAEGCGMELVVNDAAPRAGAGDAGAAPGEPLSTSVRADPSAVEQVLFNLVDNACKYAASAPDRRVHFEAGRAGAFAALTVRDHGPGIDRAEAKRLFRPFSKSARDAAGSAPGVGLGLALSRRLARGMGGDLRLDPRAAGGASLTLLLPVA